MNSKLFLFLSTVFLLTSNYAFAAVPPAPTSAPSSNISSPVTGQTYRMSWSSNSNAIAYKLREKVGANGSWKLISQSQNLYANVTRNSPGTYYYHLKYVNLDGTSAEGPARSVTVRAAIPIPAVPSRPSAPSTVNTNTQFTVSWGAVSGATEYRLFKEATRIANGGLSFKQSFPTAGSHVYKVRACNSSGCSGFSSTKTVNVVIPKPSKPATPTGPSRIEIYQPFTVRWPSVSGATRYELYKNGSLVDSDAGLSESQTITSASSANYSVKACNTSGCSTSSNALSVQAYKVGTATPTSPVSNALVSNTPCFSWDAAQDATQYTLQIGEDPTVANSAHPRWVKTDITSINACWSGSFTPNATAGTTPTNLEAGKTYYWRVKSLASAASSRQEQWTFTTPRAFSVQLPAPDVPARPTTSAPAITNKSYDVKWVSVAGADTYKVYENGTFIDEVPNTSTSYSFTQTAAGTYTYSVEACNANCSDPSLELTLSVEETIVRGHIEALASVGDDYYLKGWACQTYDNRSINVHIWAGGAADTGTLIASGIADFDSNTSVAEACNNTGTKHRFEVLIPREQRVAHAGEAIHVHGISILNTTHRVLTRSGELNVPALPVPSVPDTLTLLGETDVEQNESFTLRRPELANVRYELYLDENLLNSDMPESMDISLSEVGEYRYKIKACNEAGCNEQFSSALTVVVKPQSVVIGFVDAIVESNGEYFVSGWACQLYDERAINVQIWAGGAANTGTLIATGTANLDSNSSITERCQDIGTQHRFRVLIPEDKLAQHPLEKVYVHGISIRETEHAVIDNSGVHALPNVPDAPGIPIGPVATGETLSYEITWQDVTGATSYEIYENDQFVEEVLATAELKSSFSKPTAGEYSYTVKACASVCGESSTEHLVTVEARRVIGNIGGITEHSDHYTVFGWTCEVYNDQPIEVEFYAGGQKGQGDFIVGGLTHASSEAAISALCANQGTMHRFSLRLPEDKLQAHGGKTLYAHGVFANGTAGDLIGQSNLFKLPQNGTNEILGTPGADTLVGTNLDDVISGLAGADSITGGLGNDRLIGGPDADTYYYNLGDGNDRIIDGDNRYHSNKLIFGQGITADNITLVADNANLTITLPNEETIVIEDWYAGDYVGASIDGITFADGTVWDRTQVNRYIVITGSELNDTLGFVNSQHAFQFRGNHGDDTITGGNKGDVFRYELGDGNDTIIDRGDRYSSDILVFGEGITLDNTSFIADQTDLTINLPNEGSILVKDWFVGNYAGASIDTVIFGDGTRWERAEFNSKIVITGTDENDSLIYTNSQNGFGFRGGLGNDTLRGGIGTDRYFYTLGDGSDLITDSKAGYLYLQGIAKSEVRVFRSGNNLVLLREMSKDTITIGNWFASNNNKLYRIFFGEQSYTAVQMEAFLEDIAPVSLSYPGQEQELPNSTDQDFIAKASPYFGNEGNIQTVEFSIDGSEWFTAVITDGVYQYDFGLQEVGELTLSVRINGIEETGLTTIFNIVASLPEPQLESPVAPVLASIGSYDVESAEVSTLPGQFRVDESGAATYSVPLSVPEGIAGVTPQLSLGYNSSGGNGPLGIGWGINGSSSSISRCRHTLEQDGEDKAITLTNTDRLCLDGQKLIAVDGVYGQNGTKYRTEINNRSRITGYFDSASDSSYFTVEKEDGSISYYGAQDIVKSRSDSLLLSDDVPLNWYLTSTSDNFRLARNTIFFNYTTDQAGYGENEILIDNIEYSDNLVDFVYTTSGQRPDRTSRHFLGAQVEMTVQLNLIRVLNHNSSRVRSYHLSYETDPEVNFKRLTGISSCGVDASTCLPATTFDWHDQNPLTVESFSSTASLGDDNIEQVLPADIDGDGFTDLLYVSHLGHNSYEVNVSYNDKSGTFKAPIGVFTFTHHKSEDYPVLVRPVDIDGDGLVEILHYTGFSETGAVWKYFDFNDTSIRDVYNCSGHGENCSVSQYETHIVSLGLAASITSKDVSFHDVNSDAYPDMVYFKDGKNYIKLNDRMGGFESHTHEAAINIPAQSNPNGLGNVTSTVESMEQLPASDFNGDGRADFVFVIEDSYESLVDGQAPIRQSYWMAFEIVETDTGYQYESVGEIFETRYSAVDIDNHFLYAGDLDSDGRTDIVKLEKDSFKAYYSLSRTTGMTPAGFTGMSANQQNALGFQIIDADKDGRADIVYFDSGLKRWTVQYHTFGGGFTAAAPLTGILDDNHEQGNEQLFLADWNGNGELGVGRVNFGAKELYYRQDNEAVNLPAHRIKTITNGFGIATEINYGLMTDPALYTKGSGADSMHFGRCRYDGTNAGDLPTACTPIFDLISPGYLVKSVTSDAPSFNNTTATLTVGYHYQGMRAQAGGRGLLGFEKIRTFDQQTGVSTETVYHQNFPYIGMPKETRKFIGTQLDWASVAENKKLSFASNEYSYSMLDGDSTIYPYLARSTDTQYSLNDAGSATTKLSSVVTDNIYVIDADNHLNLEQVVVTTKHGAQDADGEFIDVASEVTTTNTYVDNVSNWWLGRVTETTVIHSIDEHSAADDIIRTSHFEYYAVDDPHEGMLKREIVEPLGTAGQMLTTLHCYSGLGNKSQSVTYANVDNVSCTTRSVDTTNDPNKVFRFSGVAFDTDFRYTTHTKDALFEPSTVNARNALGQVTQSTDINGVITKVGYDAFGRQFASSNSLGAYAETQRRLRQHAWSGTPSILDDYYFVERQTGNGTPTSYAYFDVMGRQVAAVKQGFKSNEWIHQYSRYDSYGRTVEQSVVKKTSSAAAVSPAWNKTTYDVFGRPQTIESADGTDSRIAYNSLSTTTSVTFDTVHGGTATQNNTEVKNVLGQTESVIDNDGGVLTYAYDATGNLTSVIGVDNVVIETTFDKLGRKVTMKDPNKGDWTYKYNALGELVEQTSARLHKTQFYRDSLGRTTKRVVSGGDLTENEETRYSFDAHLPAGVCFWKGASCEVNKPNTSYAYDDFGRPSTVITRLDGEPYIQQTTYDQFGRVFQQYDATGDFFGIRHHYNSQGYAYKQVEARHSAANDAKVYYEVKDMDAFGNVIHFEQNDGKVTTHKAFDANTGYATGIQANNGFLIQDNVYQFDDIGNLRSRSRMALDAGYTHRKETFEYDGLNRLTNVSGISHSVDVSYYANGKIESKSDLNNAAGNYYCYRTDKPHAVSGLGAQGCSNDDYKYDANGNMESGRGRNIIYAHFDKPTRISNSAGVTSFAYDAKRSRYKRETTEDGVATKTYYIGNVEMVYKDGQYAEARRYLPQAIQTQYKSGAIKTRYLHKDHLGSIDSITDDDGKLVEKLYFDAWGKRKAIPLHAWDNINESFRAMTVADVLDITTVTPRGFTGHEHVEHADIIHMNGRIYDPTLGRFLQADPHIQAPKNSQSYNRYSYVLNNPLSYTDPSGYFFKKLLQTIGKSRWLSAFISIALNFIPGCQGWCSIAFNAAISYAVTGSLKGALIGAFVGAISPGGFSPGAFLARAAIGGLASRLQGGKFGHGFIAAGASGAAGGIGNVPLRVIASAVIGGTVSKITGGKFANGATSAAFATAVTAGFDGEFSDSEGFWGENGDSILVDDPDNHGKELSLYDGKVKVSKWGSKDAKLNFKEMGTVKSDLGKIFGTEEGAKMLDALSTDEPLKILLNGEGVNAGARGSRIMTVDISARGYFKNMNTGNTVQVSTTRLFAHEMGHAISGHTDSRSINTLWTDTIMGQINQTSRRSYRNYCSTELLC